MSITLYSKFRRQKLRNAWSLAGMTEWCLNVGLYLVGFLVILSFLSWFEERSAQEDKRIAQSHREQSQKYSEMVAHLLNGKSLIDGDGAVYFVQVSKQEGL
jgi:hypothetical protein